MIHYDTRAARDDFVDDRIEDRFEFLVGKSNLALADPPNWIIIPIGTKFDIVFVLLAVKLWFKLPRMVRARSVADCSRGGLTSLSKASIMPLMFTGLLNEDPLSFFFNIFSTSLLTNMPPVL
jgi:hypothetical protein